MSVHATAGAPAGIGLFPGAPPPRPGYGRGGAAARLAWQAVRYAATLPSDDLQALVVRLYCYGRLPLTPAWARRLPDHAAVAEHLGVGRGGALAAAVERRWRLSGDPAAPDGWLSWGRRGAPPPPADGRSCKLYLSPRPEALREAFAALVAVLAGSDATAFKVGRDAHGVLRPDKLVAYFPSLEGLRGAAAELAARLAGLPAHGVAFTAPLTPDALVAWGADPPPAAGGQPESWRLWVATRLARAIVRARGEVERAEVPARALQIVHREHGVSPDHWEPPTAWLPAGGAPHRS